MKRTLAVFLLVSFVVMFLHLEAGAEVFNVTSTLDRVDTNRGDGFCIAQGLIARCTLRAAILEANLLPGGPHTINVPAGTYVLSIIDQNVGDALTGDLDINTSMTIVGAGPGKTIIDGGGIDRVFHIQAGTSSISGLTIRNGITTGAGGGVLVQNGVVALRDCVITGNTAQVGNAIQNLGTVSIDACTVHDNTLDNGNETVANQGTMTLGNVTVSEHLSDGSLTAALRNANTGTLTLRNTTITTSDMVAAPIALDNAGGAVSVKNTLIRVCGDIVSTACSGVITSQGHNIVSGSGCAFSVDGDVTYNGLLCEDVGLLPLDRYGSAHLVNALRETSIAIDAGEGCLLTDQRGLRRPLDGNGDRISKCDVGAYEFRKNKVGVFRSGQWPLDYNGNGAWNPPPADTLFTFGLPGDMPVAGAWTPDISGLRKGKVGVFRSGTWALDSTGDGVWNGCGVTPDKDRCYTFGLATDVPVAGDWNGGGITEIGVFRRDTKTWFLDYNGNGVWEGPVTDRQYVFGQPTDTPVTGDWNGDGKTEIGVFRPGTKTWFLDYNGNGVWEGPVTDRQYVFGQPTDTPVTGDWNGDGITDIGVFRSGTWVLDMNGNGKWDGDAIDKVFTFGLAADKPVSGGW